MSACGWRTRPSDPRGVKHLADVLAAISGGLLTAGAFVTLGLGAALIVAGIGCGALAYAVAKVYA